MCILSCRRCRFHMRAFPYTWSFLFCWFIIHDPLDFPRSHLEYIFIRLHTCHDRVSSPFFNATTLLMHAICGPVVYLDAVATASPSLCHHTSTVALTLWRIIHLLLFAALHSRCFFWLFLRQVVFVSSKYSCWSSQSLLLYIYTLRRHLYGLNDYVQMKSGYLSGSIYPNCPPANRPGCADESQRYWRRCQLVQVRFVGFGNKWRVVSVMTKQIGSPLVW